MRVSYKVCLIAITAMAPRSLIADPPAEASSAPKPVMMTTQEDHRQMLSQLGITKLRPGPSGNESAPNHANYDEEKANPFPKLPEALKLRDGKPVTTADDWWNKRRPEIVEDLSGRSTGEFQKTSRTSPGRSRIPRRSRSERLTL